MQELQNRMLGRLPSQHDPRTLRFAKYLLPAIPPPPDIRRWDAKLSDWGVMGNDRFGNCVIVTAAHALLAWRTNELDDTKRITDSAVVELSRTMGALDGFNILERLKYWRREGMWADKIEAFAAVDQTDQTAIRHAINIFGCADIGLNMPAAWKKQTIWSTGRGPRYRPNSWGGHSVPIVGYDRENLYVVTWGEIQAMTWAALTAYCDEAYAIIDKNWTALDNITPSGVDLATLRADLAVITR